MSIEIHNQRMNNVLRWIENNLDESLTVDQLADIACYSRFHFQRLFKFHTGQKIGVYCTRLRLNRAAQQMITGKKNLTSIAAEAGFENQSSFSRAFRQQFAVSPTAFIRSQLQVNIIKLG